jgi:transcriptional regulator with XRE-family HTH domain
MKQTWALANYIRERLQGLGWTQKDLAANSGVPAATISRILTRKDYEPDLSTLARLAVALEAPLWRLIMLAGYPISAPSDPEEQTRRYQALVESFPWLLPVVEDFAGLTPDDRESLLTYMEAQRLRRERKE